MLWIPLIAGLLLMKKRGAALSIAAMVITLGTIARIVIYYPSIGVYELRNHYGCHELGPRCVRFKLVFAGNSLKMLSIQWLMVFSS